MTEKSISPNTAAVPEHVAIIMDGNRRWARRRGLPAAFGHANGARRVRAIVQACASRGIRYLTLFAFSTENWQRPKTEVSALMKLLALYLQKEVRDMNAMGVRFKVIGDLSGFSPRIQALIADAQANTAHNDTITLTIAANYGGRWDMLQAAQAWQKQNPTLPLTEMNEQSLESHLSLSYAPAPDLLVRTGGDYRLSNFLLWQMAYTELHFTEVLWPAFTEEELDLALDAYAQRDRRFGGDSQLKLAS
jgi:undecaprenyl diphosphate synthase